MSSLTALNVLSKERTLLVALEKKVVVPKLKYLTRVSKTDFQTRDLASSL